MIERNKNWKGYNFDDLQFRRVLSETHIELEKHKIANDLQSLYGNKGRTSSVFSSLTGAMGYLDYAIVAFRLGSRVFKLFRRRK